MSELTAVPRSAWVETRGKPQDEIPPEIAQSMAETYQDNSCMELVIDDPQDNGTKEFVNLLKLCAERQGRRAVVQYDTNEQGAHILRYYMADVVRRRERR